MLMLYTVADKHFFFASKHNFLLPAKLLYTQSVTNKLSSFIKTEKLFYALNPYKCVSMGSEKNFFVDYYLQYHCVRHFYIYGTI